MGWDTEADGLMTAAASGLHRALHLQHDARPPAAYMRLRMLLPAAAYLSNH
jgi:hypothetical protein